MGGTMNTNTRRRSVAAFVAFAAMAIAPATMALAAPFEPAPAPVEGQTQTLANADLSLIDESKTTSLTIHKLAGTPLSADQHDGTKKATSPDREPLDGVVFRVTRVNEKDADTPVDLTTNAGWATAMDYYKNLSLAQSRLSTVAADSKEVTTGAAGTKGEAVFDGLPIGLYYVTEVSAPAGYTRAADFLVTLPMTEPVERKSWMYNVHVYPKNAHSSAEKSVADIGSWVAGMNGGAEVKHPAYTISTTANPTVQAPKPADAPEDWKPTIATLGRYEVFDNLDPRLTLAAEGVSLELDNGFTLTRETDGSKNKMTAAGDYFLYVNGKLVTEEKTPEGKGGDLVRVIFTDAGLKNLQTQLTLPEGQKSAEKVLTTITTIVNSAGVENALNYGVIENTASFIPDSGYAEQHDAPTDPTDPGNPGDPANPDDPYDPETPDTPGIPTETPKSTYGDIQLYKHAASNEQTPLQGAVFSLYRGGLGDVCKKSEMTNENLIHSGITTDNTGFVTIKGLQTSNFYNNTPITDPANYLNYCLVETKAPEGYNLRAQPIQFHVTVAGAVKIDSANTRIPGLAVDGQHKMIANEETNLGNALPLTGGAGVGTMSALALLLGAGGVGMYVKNARRSDEFDAEFDELDD